MACTYGEKRLGDFNREDMTRLVEVMAKWRLLLGVTTESTDQELIVICQFVYDNFKHFTLSDISLCMNWAISGKIEIGYVTQKTISSFYVSKALNAYEDKKRQMVNQIMENKERHLINEAINTPKPVTQAEKANAFKEYIVSLFEAYSNGGLFYDVDDSAYNWLKKQGLVNPTKEQIAAALRYGEDRYKNAQKGQSLRDIMQQSFMKKEKEEQIKKFAREFIVMQIFEEQGIGPIVIKIKAEQF